MTERAKAIVESVVGADYAGLGTIERQPSGDALDMAMIGDQVTLAEARRNARRHVRLYRDKDGRPYVQDRLYGRRYIRSIRFLTINGEPLACGAAVLESIDES